MKNQLFSLKNKLMAFFLISTMSLFVGFTIVNYHYATKNLQELSFDKLQSISKLKANKLESYVDNLSKTVQSLQSLVMVRDNLPKLEAYTKNLNSDLNQNAIRDLDRVLPRFQKIHDFFDIMLVGKNGKVVYSSNSAERADDVGIAINAKVSELFEHASKKIYFSEPFLYNPTDKDLTLMVAAPIADEQNNFIGLICIELRLASLQYLVEDFLGLGQTGESYLVIKKTDDVILIRSSRSTKKLNFIEKLSHDAVKDTPIDFVGRGESGQGSYLNFSNKQALTTWEPIRSASVRNLGLITFIEMNEVLAPVNALVMPMAIIFLTVIGITLIIVNSISNHITQPLRELTIVAEEFSKGNFKCALPVIETKDELKLLADTFGKIAPTLISKERLEIEIEQRIKKEEDLIAAQAGLARNQRMAALGMLGAGIAHELNNPMMGIINQVQYVLTKLEPESKAFLVLNDALLLSRRAIAIIQDLLSYSREQDDHNTLRRYGHYSDIKIVLAEALKTRKDLIEKNKITVNLQIDKFDELVGLANSPLQRIIENLITNACDAMEDRSERCLSLSLHRAQNYIELLIADTGSGMDELTRSRLFEPFFTTKAVGKGTGLGLVLCKNLIDSAEGIIEIDSKIEFGTTFKIRLPALTQVQHAA